MNTPVKLGYLVPQFPGQTHIFFWREVCELEKCNAKITLFSTRHPPKGLIAHSWSHDAVARTTYIGIPNFRGLLAGLVRLPFLVKPHECRRLWRDLIISAPAAWRLVRETRAHMIPHVHVHSCGRAALVAALARRMGGPTYSLTLHGPLSDYGPGQVLKWSGAAFGTVITEKLKAELIAELGEALPARLPVRAMGVDPEVLKRPNPYVPKAPGAPLRLFCCARLNVVKGHQDLLQAVRILLDRGVDVQLEIAGEDDAGGGGYHRKLQARLEELSLTNNARLLGAIDANAVREKLLGADIFVLASWHEPLGVAYMEAMSCEVPTIGTDAGGVRELIRDGQDGIIVPPKDPARLADAIQNLSEDPVLAQRLSKGGRARIIAGFRASLGAETLRKEIARL